MKMSIYRAKSVCATLILMIIVGLVLFAFVGDTNLLRRFEALLSNVGGMDSPAMLVEGTNGILGDGLENNAVLKDSFAYLQMVLGKDEIRNFEMIRTEQDSLLFGGYYDPIPEWYDELAQQIQTLSDTASEWGTKLIYLNVPDAYVRGYTQVQTGMPAYDRNAHQDAILYYLHAYGVETVDFREVLKSSGLPASQFVYRTDFRWTNEAAFAGFTGLISILNERFGIVLDPDGLYTDATSYEQTTYPNAMLGENGRRVGAAFAVQGEDLTTILPAFNTDFTYEKSGNEIDTSATKQQQIGDHSYRTIDYMGSFADTLFQAEHLRTANVYESNGENLYLDARADYHVIKNQLLPEGKKALLIGDTYILPLAAFLAPTFGEIQVARLDKTMFTSGDLDVQKLLQEESFDFLFIEQFTGGIHLDSFSYK